MVPLVTVIALSYAGLLEGSVLTETVFAWPGLGLYITNSLQNADMNAVLGGTIIVGSIFVGLNLLSDVLYKIAGPKDAHPMKEPPTPRLHPCATGSPPTGRARAAEAFMGRVYHGCRDFSRNRLAMLGLLIVLGLVGVAIFADLLAPYSATPATCAPRGCCRLRGRTGSAPTTRAATSSRASSSARASR